MKEALDRLRPRLMEIFTYLHAHPEISWKEVETTNYIVDLLTREGFSPQRFKNCTGLYVDIGKGNPKVGLRTDIDALWQEVDGEFRANHSCGHDGHMTMAIGALLLLKEQSQLLKGTVRVIFQPAEEKGTGALAVLKEGIIDDLDYLFGVHLRPVHELEDGTYCAALYHGASRLLEGEIIGEDAHAARPHLGVNAIEVGATIIEDLRTIHTDPMVPVSIKMTKFQAGGDSGNIIPGRAAFTIDIRAQRNDVMETLALGVKRVIDSSKILHKVQIELQTVANIVAAEVDTTAQYIMEQAIVKAAGLSNLRKPVHTPGGEDFHHYAVQRPHLKSTMLGLGCGLTPGLHHPKMKFKQARLVTGVEILTNAVLGALKLEP
ncbi:amidohydrolase [Lysinibacillus sphaericus]|uniref:Amidohydrolase n=4 Tax=Lysinibacillus TaxID=400634 RepID=A0A2S0JVU7_LYSSH|nr:MULTISPECIES: M20 peptidase aminoacylase family protein [Lysinibacillus]AHN23559.1 amidohydrolase [Lysinibacillus varians]AVK95198.1 amidohydrolase [Lysinibacillus sphaericus]MCS1381704.1 M20 peptidase aminoacylase family protein [Lysinibacillus sphaericus]MED4545166.1 M20 peptidase aminoacylase family protein [Lysinibacillus sphaericus]TKI18630.1 amidohydrolase [Lysinibacillus sphaericus]